MTPSNLFRAELSDAATAIGMLQHFEAAILQAVDLIASTLLSGNKLLTCGNGGSAADASHLATEFVIRFEDERRAFPAISLVDSGQALSAAVNDYGGDEIFARQVSAFGKPDDLLVVFSTSGNSTNVIRAIEVAKQANLKTIAFLGRDGGRMRGLCDLEFIVPASKTRHVQEAHLVLYHAMCTIIETKLK
jgi:phosphoheptose isomerase